MTRRGPRQRGFDAVNTAALAAFPAVLDRLLPRGKAVGREFKPSTPAAPTAIRVRSK